METLEHGATLRLPFSPLVLLVNTLSVLSFCLRPSLSSSSRSASALLRRQLLVLTMKKLEPAPVEFRAQQIEGFSNHLFIWSAPTFPSLTASRRNIFWRECWPTRSGTRLVRLRVSESRNFSYLMSAVPIFHPGMNENTFGFPSPFLHNIPEYTLKKKKISQGSNNVWVPT